MGVASDLIAEALALAGNTGISSTTALAWLNHFLDAEYRRKYPWQRKTVSIPFAAGAVSNTAQWDTTFLDIYEQQDQSCGRWTDASNNVSKVWRLAYREYVAIADRLTQRGQPRHLVADVVGATWYVYPAGDQAYTIAAEIYALPATVALGGTPLWSSYAPDEILVQAIKTAALFHMDDSRYATEKAVLFGDHKQDIPGMLPTYRRRMQNEQGNTVQTALDQRVFASMKGWDW